MPNWVSNHLYIDAQEDKLQEILESIRADGKPLGSIDFNKIIPMPESLNVTKGSITDKAIDAFLSHLKLELELNPDHPRLQEETALYTAAASKYRSKEFFPRTEQMTSDQIDAEAKRNQMSRPEFLALGKQYLDNEIQYGAATWLEWSNEHWGTKWTADQEEIIEQDDPHLLYFNTAWSAPFPVIQALSEKFPEASFEIQWADEDIGYNLGNMTFRNGQIQEAYMPEGGSKEAFEFYFELEGSEPADHYLKYDPETDTYIYDEELEQRTIDLYHAKQNQITLEEKVTDALNRSSDSSSRNQSDRPEPTR